MQSIRRGIFSNSISNCLEMQNKKNLYVQFKPWIVTVNYEDSVIKITLISCKVNSLRLSNKRGFKISAKTATAKTTPYYQLTSSHSVSKILYWCATAFWVFNRRQCRGDSAADWPLSCWCFEPTCFCFLRTSSAALVGSLAKTHVTHVKRVGEQELCVAFTAGGGRFPYPLDWRRWSTKGRTRVRHRACTCSCRRWTLAALRTQTHPRPPLVYSGAPPAVKNRVTGKGYLGCLSGSCSPRSSGEMSFKHTRQTPGRPARHLHRPFVCCGA